MSESRRYVLDTNHACRFLETETGLPARIEEARRIGAQFLIPTPVYAELLYGAYGSSHVGENLAIVLGLAERLGLVGFGRREAERYADMAVRQKALGRPVPAIDMQIAAIAVVHDCAVLTADKHFDLIEGLEVENWLDINEDEG